MKISIIGAGNVGASLCYELAIRKLCSQIALVDIFENVAKGKAMDISQACMGSDNFSCLIASKNYEDIKDSDIVVITAGSPRKPGMSRSDLLLKNASITKEIAKNIALYAPNSISIEVANPLDAMTYVVLKQSGFDRKKVLGMAGVLDSSRMGYHILNQLDFTPKKIDSLVIGSHNDKMLPLARFARVDGKCLNEFISDEKINQIIQKTKEGGAKIVSLLNTSAYYAPAYSVALMIEAIVNDSKAILPCCVMLDGEYGYKDVTCGVPVKLGRDGVLEIEELNLDAKERSEFELSVDSVKSLLEVLREHSY
ncbi:MAG: malate dehydrogenase [Proteobacteria bacterium]|nr:MAG: malate dehydrogenase [Pseudomonadota bacterium]